MKTKHEKIVEILKEHSLKVTLQDKRDNLESFYNRLATAIEQLEPEGNRPTIKEYFGEDVTPDRVHETYIEQPELFQYAQALDRYIDSIEPPPQQPSEEEIAKIMQWVFDNECEYDCVSAEEYAKVYTHEILNQKR